MADDGRKRRSTLTLEIDSDYAGTQLTKDDDFTYSSNKLDLEWQWNHNPDNTAWSVTERPGYLRLKTIPLQPICWMQKHFNTACGRAFL
ncbi:MAG: hypothetical protein ACLR1R_10175 [Ruminococcus callidus]